MAQHTGASGEATGEAIASARAALAARDRDLADADRELSAILAGAHATAIDAIGRLESIRGEIDMAVAQQSVATPAEGREFARLLLDKQRELVETVANARADADAKVSELRELSHRYR
ncbi:MAG: DUF4226 domain-containing protein [Mycobacterium sp.]